MEDKRSNFFQYVLVMALIGASFWTGTLYQQVQMLRSGGAQVAGTQVAADDNELDPEVQAPVVLEGDDWKELLDKPAATLGDKNAKVAMVEFTDYQCPFCKRAFDQTWPQIKKDYIDSGKMLYVVRDLPLSFHPNAKPAALAARCAGEQNNYIEMHDKLYQTQDEWSSLSDPKEKYVGYAGDLGLNAAKFTSCFDDKKYQAEVDADSALASKVGATGTPTYFINGKQVVGAQPIAAFATVIEAELNK